MSGGETVGAWRGSIDKLKSIAIDWALLAVCWLMVEFLLLAFSGRRGPTGILLTAEQILDLLHQPPDYGPLADPKRRASCLNGLGYPASTPILGAQPVDVNSRTGVLLLLAGDTPEELVAVAVAPNCSSADAGVLTKTVINRQ